MTVPADWGKRVVDCPFLFHLSLMPFFLETFPPFESLVVHHCSPHLLLHHLLLRNCCWYCSPEETGQHELINVGTRTRTSISPVSTSRYQKHQGHCKCCTSSFKAMFSPPPFSSLWIPFMLATTSASS